MPEHEVQRPKGQDVQAELAWAEEQGYDEGAVTEAKQYAIGVLSDILGIFSDQDDWMFNVHPHGWTWLSTCVDGLMTWVYTSGHRMDRVYCYIMSSSPHGLLEHPHRRIRSLGDLTEAVERDRYNREHPDVPGPYDNMG